MMVKTVVDRVADSYKKFLDVFIAETNLLEGNILSEGNLSIFWSNN